MSEDPRSSAAPRGKDGRADPGAGQQPILPQASTQSSAQRSVPQEMQQDAPPETIATYLRLRGLAPGSRKYRRGRRQRDDENQPFTAGRDPRGLGDIVNSLTREQGWDSQLARHDLVRDWASIAGEHTAEHATPVGLSEGTLTVQCDSTAWATQLTLMRSALLTSIVNTYPEAGIVALRFTGPDVPSWKWGPRTIPGRGPRDTYG